MENSIQRLSGEGRHDNNAVRALVVIYPKGRVYRSTRFSVSPSLGEWLHSFAYSPNGNWCTRPVKDRG